MTWNLLFYSARRSNLKLWWFGWDIPGCLEEIALLHHVSRRACMSGHRVAVCSRIHGVLGRSSEQPVLWKVLGTSHIGKKSAQSEIGHPHPSCSQQVKVCFTVPTLGCSEPTRWAIPFNSGHRYFLAESSGPSYTRAGAYTQNSFIYSWWDLGIAHLQQFLLFLYVPLLKCHFWSWIEKWLAWKSWSAWFPKYIFKILRVYNCWKCSFCKTQGAHFLPISTPLEQPLLLIMKKPFFTMFIMK